MPRLLSQRGILGAIAVALVALPGRVEATDGHKRPNLMKGCGSCHAGHGTRRTTMLRAREEELCFQCHGSPVSRAGEQREGRLALNVSLRDISADFRRPFRHPVERTFGVHRGDEQLPERDSGARRHVECADCHRAHRPEKPQAKTTPGGLPRRSTLDGSDFEYELCYRCHSDSVNLPRLASDIRRAVSPKNRSYHPIEAAGRGDYVPSLRTPLSTSSRISCGDCHGNDQGPGIHGSRFQFLLRQNYTPSSGTPESAYAYALCYECHDRGVLFSGAGFSEHERHVRDGRISCAACHDAHGSYSQPSLLAFSMRDVRPDPTTGKLEHVSLGRGRGACYLSCHGRDHSGEEYCEPGGDCERRRKDAPLRTPNDRSGRTKRSPFSF